MSEEVADVIDSTADVIEKYGWTRGEMVDQRGRRCTLGGVRTVGKMSPGQSWELWPENTLKAIKVLAKEFGPAVEARFGESAVVGRYPCDMDIQAGFVTMWNDHLALGKQDVLDRLREIAKNQRKESV